MEPLIKFLEAAFYLLMSGGLLGLVVIVWAASARFTRLEATIETIVGNHLPHIYDRLGKIEEALSKNGRN